MEKIDKIAPMAQQTLNLPRLSHKFALQKNEAGEYTLSVYSGELTLPFIAEQLKKLKLAFPELETGFYKALADRITELKFSNDRLADAINNLIDNCVYPRPTIAQIISWDRRVKLYTHNQIIELANQYGSNVWDDYRIVDLPSSIPLRAHKTDIERYKLKIKANNDRQMNNML